MFNCGIFDIIAFKEVLPVSRRCEICNKGVVFGHQISHSDRKSNRSWAPNIKRVKAIVDGSPKRICVCTRCLRSGKVQRAL